LAHFVGKVWGVALGALGRFAGWPP